jgi:hypothetical protein
MGIGIAQGNGRAEAFPLGDAEHLRDQLVFPDRASVPTGAQSQVIGSQEPRGDERTSVPAALAGICHHHDNGRVTEGTPGGRMDAPNPYKESHDGTGGRDETSGAMTNGRTFDKPATYEIRVKGCLGQKWSDWFEGLAIVPQDNDETLLTGCVADESALHGLLAKIRNLGIPLLLVRRVEDASDG